MKLRKLGKNGPEISALGIGAMSFSDFYGATTEENSFAILDAARAAGVTHIDTSNVYGMGRSETAIGAYLKANPGARDQFHIATKAGISSDAEGRRVFKNTLDHLESELDGSLKRLGLDCVDLFYVHRRQADIPIEEVAGHMARLREKGKIRGIGFSEIAPASLRRAVTETHVDAVQSEYSLSTRLPEMGLVQTCAQLGTALMAFSPVGRSFLTDDPIPLSRVPDLAFLKVNPRFIQPNYQANIAATDPFRAYAAQLGVPAAALAISWVLAQGDHIIAIPGTRATGHFAELVTGANLKLSADQLAQIAEILPIGWAHGDRYSPDQNIGPEAYC
ncbi:aldo/keto reductase [Thalassobius sp. S69A]|uniref:aldo/keto reductase n=1 Tax=unclassified Thalassovita TaxID=2619711 RepID=UPI000C0D0671|nr:aldo/keto reductase [Paracoccaceae bacterium]